MIVKDEEPKLYQVIKMIIQFIIIKWKKLRTTMKLVA